MLRDSLIPRTRAGLAVSVSFGVVYFAVLSTAGLVEQSTRLAIALIVLTFVLAVPDERRVDLTVWIGAVAFVAWLATSVHLVQARPLAGALVGTLAFAIIARGGERALAYYVPSASNEEGFALQRSIRREFITGSCLFLFVFVADGFLGEGARWSEPRLLAVWRLLRVWLVGISALFFVRWLLKQSKFLGLTARSAFSDEALSRLVPAQRWPILLVSLIPIVVGAILGQRSINDLLGPRAETTALLTCAFITILSAFLFLVALVRLQRARSWTRRSVRGASFLAGVMLSLALAATLVELAPHLDGVTNGSRSEGSEGRREVERGAGRDATEVVLSDRAARTVRTMYFTAAALFLIALPFANENSKLLAGHAKWHFFSPPIEIAILASPFAFLNGSRWHFPSAIFWATIAGAMLVYYAVIALRRREAGGSRGYAIAVVAVAILLVGHGTEVHVPILFKYFFAAIGFVLYGFDLVERSGRKLSTSASTEVVTAAET